MALWKDPVARDTATAQDAAGGAADSVVRSVDRSAAVGITGSTAMAGDSARRTSTSGASRESLIAADVTIEGKIEGAGDIRIAGRFKGDVNVQGNVTVEKGAHVTGQVQAGTVVVGGEIEGNITATSRVELLESGVVSGDVKAALLSVAAGSRMRGQADFGWADQGSGRK
jgi:cytoskeletal protein CcmA (bactofilin family)